MNEIRKTPDKMISIWTWVGIILSGYGLIITGMGIYYAANPETLTATASYNPSLWWGIIMFVFGAVFLLAPRIAQKLSAKKHK